MGMRREDILNTAAGEFEDLMAADAIMKGTAKQIKKRKMSYIEAMRLE